MSSEVFTRRFYKHHSNEMYVNEVIPDPSKDEVFVYELPELDVPDAVIMPVFNATYGTLNRYSMTPNLEDFGVPFFIVLTKEDESDYDKIYDKIRQKYVQFSDAPELKLSRAEQQHQEGRSDEEEDLPDEQDAMQDVSDEEESYPPLEPVSPPALVTLRVQPYRRTFVRYPQQQDDLELPTSLNKSETLLDLKDYLQPKPERITTVSPSPMESVHNQLVTPPVSDSGDPFADQRRSSSASATVFNESESLRHAQETSPLAMEDDDRNLVESPAMEQSPSEMLDISDSDGDLPPALTASQLVERFSRGAAPSPAIDSPPPAYSSFHDGEEDDDVVPRLFKFGDALVCEWSGPAYSHVFQNPLYTTDWETFTRWVDPSPPPPVLTARQKRNIDLEDCLHEFAREEQLGENDEWWCPKCKAHRQAKKTLVLWRVPDIFVIHLKRFSANRSFRDKLDNLVEFPLTELDLTDRVGDKTWIEEERGGERMVYDLFAVDNHFGGLAGGHYTAYAKNFVDEKWYYFDGLHL
jgi:ubiquitin carboxyl-terminal hydrolase 4/11